MARGGAIRRVADSDARARAARLSRALPQTLVLDDDSGGSGGVGGSGVGVGGGESATAPETDVAVSQLRSSLWSAVACARVAHAALRDSIAALEADQKTCVAAVARRS